MNANYSSQITWQHKGSSYCFGNYLQNTVFVKPLYVGTAFINGNLPFSARVVQRSLRNANLNLKKYVEQHKKYVLKNSRLFYSLKCVQKSKIEVMALKHIDFECILTFSTLSSYSADFFKSSKHKLSIFNFKWGQISKSAHCWPGWIVWTNILIYASLIADICLHIMKNVGIQAICFFIK